CNHAEQCGFPGSVLAPQDVEAPRLKLQGNVAHGGAAAVNLRDAINLYGRSVRVQEAASVFHGWRLRIRRRLSARARLGSILGRTLGLEFPGVEHAVTPEFADGQRLRVVLERVRRRLGAFVAHPKNLAILSLGIHFNQHKIRIGSNLADRSWLHGAGNAQVARVSNLAHVVELLDGYVIALALLNAGPGEPRQTT